MYFVNIRTNLSRLYRQIVNASHNRCVNGHIIIKYSCHFGEKLIGPSNLFLFSYHHITNEIVKRLIFKILKKRKH